MSFLVLNSPFICKCAYPDTSSVVTAVSKKIHYWNLPSFINIFSTNNFGFATLASMEMNNLAIRSWRLKDRFRSIPRIRIP